MPASVLQFPDAVQVRSASRYNQISLRLTEAVDVRVVSAMESKNPCFYLDLYGASCSVEKETVPVRDTALIAYHIQNYPNVLRLVFFPKRRSFFRVLNAETGSPYPLSRAAEEKFVPRGGKTRHIIVQTAVESARDLPGLSDGSRRRWRVVLDPGHGGKDPGATASFKRKNYREKDIVLPIAQYAREYLEATGQVEVILTRNSDYYMSLQSRLNFAEKHKADLFVSIHVNAARYHRKGNSRGIEFYYLSKTPHPDSSDLVQAENDPMQESLDASASHHLDLILQNVAEDILREFRADSIDLCDNLSSVFKSDRYFRNHHRGVKRAPFRVLMNREMPAVLMEAGFIDHPEEGPLLAKKDFQQRVARLMAQGIRRFLARQ